MKITIFNGKIHYKLSFSIAMLNYQRVYIRDLFGYPMPYDILYDNVISYHMQVKYMHTIRTCITLHCIIYCALHYSTLQYITLQYITYIHNYILVGGFNPSENISQLGVLFPTYGKIKAMF